MPTPFTQSGSTNIGDNAAQACKTISSMADNITAAAGGAAKLVAAAWGPFSPTNYSSSNEAKSQLKNILGIDMSEQDIQNINTACSNTFSGVQINEIDMTQCPFCRERGCNAQNITQENQLKNQQNCTIQIMTNLLRQKSTDVNSVAAAKALQDAQGLLTNNKVSTDTCNYTSQDMSSKSYMEQISKCSNQASSIQKNLIKGCGPVMDVIQKNDFANYQNCMNAATTSITSDVASEIKLVGESTTEQKAKGLDIDTSKISMSSIFFYCCCCCCCILLLILGGVGMMMTSGSGGSGAEASEAIKSASSKEVVEKVGGFFRNLLR